MIQKSLSDEFDVDTQPNLPKWMRIRSGKEFLWAMTALFWFAEFLILLVEFVEKL